MSTNGNADNTNNTGNTDPDGENPGTYPTSDYAERRSTILRIHRIRRDILTALTTYDDIRFHKLPNVDSLYATTIGCWEVRALDANLAMRRAKRRLALGRAQINQGLPIDRLACEQALDREFADWTDVLEARRGIVHDTLLAQVRADRPSATQTAKMHRIFRILARRFHPDLHPGDTSAMDTYLLAQHYFRDFDLGGLAALEAATRRSSSPDDAADDAADESYANLSTDELLHECELLESQLQSARERVEQLKESEDYILGRNLHDALWVDEQVTPLRERIEHDKRLEERYEAQWVALLRGAREAGDGEAGGGAGDDDGDDDAEDGGKEADDE